MKQIPDNSIDSIVTDPPYEIGFMGKGWDSTGIANNVDMRKECLRVLKPGGHLLSFAATRTYHRMACAIEDAGFEVRDMIEWVYGSGFPKSLNIGKAVDKLQGNEREEIRDRTGAMNNSENSEAQSFTKGDVGFKTHFTETKGSSPYEGWGTALKPAHEPICMARKPLAEKTVAENVLKYGTGGINIDESRVETNEVITNHSRSSDSAISKGKYGDSSQQETHQTNGQLLGRFPANLIHDNSEEVRECFPNESERFFKSIIYQAKASKSERDKGCEELEERPIAINTGEAHNIATLGRETKYQNNHPTVKPIALMEYLIKMVTKEGGTVLDPFTGSGTTLVAAKRNLYNYIGFELSKEYCDIIEARLRSVQVGLF